MLSNLRHVVYLCIIISLWVFRWDEHIQ